MIEALGRQKLKSRSAPAQKKEKAESKTSVEQKKQKADHASKRGLVVLDGNRHSMAIATRENTKVIFDKKVKIQNKHRRGGQSQNRYQRLAQESRINHLKIIIERMQRAFGKDGQLVDEIVLAGPGSMKDELLEELPRSLADLVSSTQAVARTGRPGLYDLTQMLNGGQVVDAVAECSEDEQDDEEAKVESLGHEDEEENEDDLEESLPASDIHYFSEDELTKILNRESKWLKKQLGAAYCKQINVLIAEKLVSLQNQADVDLRTADVDVLREEFLGLEEEEECDEEEEMILDTSLCVLEVLLAASALEVDLYDQAKGPKRRSRGKRSN